MGASAGVQKTKYIAVAKKQALAKDPEVGDIVKALDGQEMITDGVEYYNGNDEGQVRAIYLDWDSCFEDWIPKFEILWARTGRTTVFPKHRFRVMLRLVVKGKPEPGDIVRALPSESGVMEFRDDYRADDEGLVTGICFEDDAEHFDVVWQRTGKVGRYKKSGWRRWCCLISKGEPGVGDIVQALENSEYHHNGTQFYRDGDTGVVTRFYNEKGIPKFDVRWERSGETSSCQMASWMNVVSMCRKGMPEPGDIIQALEDKSYTAGGREFYIGGDYGTVQSTYTKSNVEKFDVRWRRTGMISSYPRPTWTMSFRLVEKGAVVHALPRSSARFTTTDVIDLFNDTCGIRFFASRAELVRMDHLATRTIEKVEKLEAFAEGAREKNPFDDPLEASEMETYDMLKLEASSIAPSSSDSKRQTRSVYFEDSIRSRDQAEEDDWAQTIRNRVAHPGPPRAKPIVRVDDVDGPGGPRKTILQRRDKAALLNKLRRHCTHTDELAKPGLKHVSALLVWHGCQAAESARKIARYGFPGLGMDDRTGPYGHGRYTSLESNCAAQRACDFPEPKEYNKWGEWAVVLCVAVTCVVHPLTMCVEDFTGDLPPSNPLQCVYFENDMKPHHDTHIVGVKSGSLLPCDPKDADFHELVISEDAQLMPLAIVWFKETTGVV
eukprot:gnl/TRDRNA2_/TRDRNA2_187309_c0_seq1.p1 gnl/TRDRNA2_/TRDRNA2_187309_c0~~gnl/TRDRNA2_/TRDRNA2_187309_c0_seq1.p1  ORF type:complete len:683 (+),score=101.78 gnl/TRDRNA2_/TRDRNA2_187309_c0_seq1:59-2050(+)